MKFKRIYFTGAHSTGKTTLAQLISHLYILPLVTESARIVAKKMGKTLDEIRADLNLVDEYQTAIAHLQIEAEVKAYPQFVSDRSFDFLCYSAGHSRATYKIWNMPEVQTYLASLKDQNAIVFFLRPHKTLVKADDFRSNSDLAWDSVCRFDGQVQFILEVCGIPYVPVECLSLRDRLRTVQALLGRTDSAGNYLS